MLVPHRRFCASKGDCMPSQATRRVDDNRRHEGAKVLVQDVQLAATGQNGTGDSDASRSPLVEACKSSIPSRQGFGFVVENSFFGQR